MCRSYSDPLPDLFPYLGGREGGTNNTLHLFVTQALAAELGEGAFVGTLASDSSNVVELVETLYNVSYPVSRHHKCFSE